MYHIANMRRSQAAQGSRAAHPQDVRAVPQKEPADGRLPTWAERGRGGGAPASGESAKDGVALDEVPISFDHEPIARPDYVFDKRCVRLPEALSDAFAAWLQRRRFLGVAAT